MNRLLKILIGLLLLAVAAGWLYSVFTTPGLRPVVVSVDQPARLYIPKSTYALGPLAPGARIRQDVVLYNTGGQTLYVEDAQPLEPAGMDVHLPDGELSPGSSDTLRVVLRAPRAPGPFSRTVAIQCSAPRDGRQMVSFTGVVTGAPRPTPPEADVPPGPVPERPGNEPASSRPAGP